MMKMAFSMRINFIFLATVVAVMLLIMNSQVANALGREVLQNEHNPSDGHPDGRGGYNNYHPDGRGGYNNYHPDGRGAYNKYHPDGRGGYN
ncbi:hypothetical protein O6P43_019858 [Quillaja saponaria]|uniref:Uncharacterized protein n=1 Tax=Quillaja saponaria TaxID=32244 RepID=A0AAD7LJD1_QUISA|nr:hypothetical protein O6P43_019858 [Quillaja saponaria]